MFELKLKMKISILILLALLTLGAPIAKEEVKTKNNAEKTGFDYFGELISSSKLSEESPEEVKSSEALPGINYSEVTEEDNKKTPEKDTEETLENDTEQSLTEYTKEDSEEDTKEALAENIKETPSDLPVPEDDKTKENPAETPKVEKLSTLVEDMIVEQPAPEGDENIEDVEEISAETSEDESIKTEGQLEEEEEEEVEEEEEEEDKIEEHAVNEGNLSEQKTEEDEDLTTEDIEEEDDEDSIKELKNVFFIRDF